jgi:PRTRC genetic system protein E
MKLGLSTMHDLQSDELKAWLVALFPALRCCEVAIITCPKEHPRMFVELLPLLRNRTVSLSIAVPANGDSIVLTIMPKITDEKAEEFGTIKDAAVKALSGALTLKAQSAEELDAGLHQALLQYVGSQLTIEGSINEMVKTVKAAEEEAKEAAKAAVAAAKKKSGQATTGSKPSYAYPVVSADY